LLQQWLGHHCVPLIVSHFSLCPSTMTWP
jgi:hypothetical protein